MPAPRPAGHAASSSWAPVLLGLALALLAGLGFRGLAGDEEVGHFLIARFAPAQPELFLSPYGRPLVTLGFALPAQGGLWIARLLAVAMAGATTFAVVRLARLTGWSSPMVAVSLLFIQPFFLGYVSTVMSEPWAAFLVAWGLLAYVERRTLVLALVAGLLPLARQEWVVFWPVVGYVLYREKRLRHAWLLFLPMLLWAAALAIRSGDLLKIIRQVDWRTYSERDVSHYFVRFHWIVGTGLLVPLLVGLAAAVRGLFRKGETQKEGVRSVFRERTLMASAVVVVTMLVVYTGFAVWHPVTFGMLRFLAGLAPACAMLALAGISALVGSRRTHVWVGLGVAAVGIAVLWSHHIHDDTTLSSRWDPLPALSLVAWAVFFVIPGRPRFVAAVLPLVFGAVFLIRSHRATLHLTPSASERIISRAAGLLGGRLGPGSSIISSHPALAFRLDQNPYDRGMFADENPQSLNRRADTEWLFWDSHYTPTHGSAFFLSSLLSNERWEYYEGWIGADSTLAVALFRRNRRPERTREDALPPGTLSSTKWTPAAQLIQAGIPRIRRKVESDPGNARNWVSLAYRQQKVGDPAGALRSVAEADRLDPHNPSATAIRASVLLGAGKTAQALSLVQSARQRHPNHSRLRYLLGRVLLESDRSQDAIPHLVSAAQSLREDWDAQYVAGVVLSRNRSWAEAEHYLRASLTLKPAHPEATLLTAEAALQQGKLADAEDLLRGLIETHRDLPQAYLRLGEILQRRGLETEARQVWRDGFERTRDRSLGSRLGPRGR